ncbi:hypothetical protein GF373_17190 [bacterium]|nr:hypothetical protein [bacterium]
MAYENLPLVEQSRLDGNLSFTETNDDPITLVIGTATQGDSETLYAADSLSEAAAHFGKSGTLIRGMYEAAIGGARRIRLFRIGATSAKLEQVGGGITVETIAKDDSAGTSYKIFWEHSAGRLRVWRVSDDELIYDNNPSYPTQAVDNGEVSVTGSKVTTSTWEDIGSLSTPLTLAAADGEGGGASEAGASYTAGTDGTGLSRMEMFEALYNAYELLEDQLMDVVVPMNVYLDDLNVMDLTASQITTLGLASLSDYPTAGSSTDALGKVYVQEYEGQNYFWWWFPSSPTSPTFTTANIYPSVGSSSSTTNADGTTLTADDFHEVNFGYQLAYFCYNHSVYTVDVTGNIGVLPPTSWHPREISKWVGKLPTTITDVNGRNIISTNGSGLLGNKWMVGRKSGTLPAHSINGVDGLYGGGFIATDDGWSDGTQLTDANDQLVDIGAYISVIATYPTLINNSQTQAYQASGAATYAGFYSQLPPEVSPANSQLSMISLPVRISPRKINLLAGAKYVTFHAKPGVGYVVSDAPTAARVESDYRRLSTVRIVKAAVDSIRLVSNPFLGKPLSKLRQQALDAAITESLQTDVKEERLTRYDKSLNVTRRGRILGHAVLELSLVPVFELRKIFIVVGLKPQ